MGLQQVHLRINDAATGQPTPVRLRITDAAGTYYAPFGRLAEFATGVNQDVGGNVQIGSKKWAYIDGACEILLPPGKLHIEISKGFEYKPIEEEITFVAGKMSLRFTIERWCDMRKEGWYSGDTRVHFMSPDAVLLEGQAEDVAVVNLLAMEHEHAIGPTILSFSGQAFARQTERCGVAVNTHNWHRDLGSLGLLHCHRVVYPLTFEGGAWTLYDWCGQCHRKKGLVIWTNPQRQAADLRYGEPLADLILGEIDAIEFATFQDSPFDECADYYKFLDAGYVVPLTGASAKNSNATVLGGLRTFAYVHPDEPFSYTKWIEAVRAGRTFVSNAPLLSFTVDGKLPGKTLDVGSAACKMTLRAVARCMVPFVSLELLWNGTVIGSANASSAPPFEAILERELMPRSGWLAVRCRAKLPPPGSNIPCVFAHSSAVAIRKEGEPSTIDPARLHLRAELANLRQYAKNRQMARLVHVVEEARTVLAKKISG